jgi:aubergine-like protein
MYRITGVDFTQTPLSKFETSSGVFKSFGEYYLEKYSIKIQDIKQPLLIHQDRRSQKKLYLIPELCAVTGLSEKQRNDFHLMQNLAKITKPDAQKRLSEAAKLIDLFYKNTETKTLMDNWNIKISKECEDVPATKLEAGNLIMGKSNPSATSRMEFPLENTAELERKTQTVMFSQPELEKWAVFCPARDRDTCQNFLQTMLQCVQTFNYPMKQPKTFFVNGNRFNDWLDQMNGVLDETVQAAVFLLAGPKKNGQYYTEIKRLLIRDRPVPSQVVLLKTILAGKGLRSICNKILIQICAKIGGIPWTISHLPFTDRPTMMVGIDVYHKTTNQKKNSILAFCATVDRYFTKYWTTVRVQESGQEIGTQLQSAMTDALADFLEVNKLPPAIIIVFRDGVSDSQRKSIEDLEVSALRNALKPETKLIFICVNKRINARFYLGDNMKKNQPLSNPPQGTLVQTKVCTDKDFYLISQKANQGTASPSHFFILVNDLEDEQDSKGKIQLLCYKMCYLYFNWVGSIKVPAPIQYAHKLSNLIGDKFGTLVPHPVYGKKKSLYFI